MAQAKLLITFKVNGAHELLEGFVYVICLWRIVYHTYIVAGFVPTLKMVLSSARPRPARNYLEFRKIDEFHIGENGGK